MDMHQLYQVLGYPPDDERFRLTRHTDTIYPITRFTSQEAVDLRREELVFNLRMSAGLYPWPQKTPLNIKRENVGTFDGYSVQKIMFETIPGFWSTGNLFLPHPLPDKAPAIFNVIGHWEEQRLTRTETGDYPQQLANFAKMGFICLVTDMIGMVDSRQISHKYGGKEKELWLSNGLGIMLWNNIRALDVLCSIPQVDVNNIGMTGASGGGSQTLFLSLLDHRVKAIAPINMISLHMQGGCQCENAPCLRRNTDNAEMCAMLAPRPLFLAGADGDWTKNLESAELPAVMEAYRQYHAEDMVSYFYQSAPHQYNKKTRHHVYTFFAKHLMGKDIIWEEQDIETTDLMAWTWFQGQSAAPGLANDHAFFEAHKISMQKRLSSLSDDEKRKMLAWVINLRPHIPQLVALGQIHQGETAIDKYLVMGEHGEKLPLIKITPQNADGQRVCLVLSDMGKVCLASRDIQAMLKDGVTLVSADVFQTGESANQKQTLTINGIAAEEPLQPFHTTFNDTTDALRVQDICLLSQVALTFGNELTLWANGHLSVDAALALPLLDNIKSAKLERKPLQIKGDQAYLDQCFIPGICAIGGIDQCLTLAKCDIQFF